MYVCIATFYFSGFSGSHLLVKTNIPLYNELIRVLSCSMVDKLHALTFLQFALNHFNIFFRFSNVLVQPSQLNMQMFQLNMQMLAFIMWPGFYLGCDLRSRTDNEDQTINTFHCRCRGSGTGIRHCIVRRCEECCMCWFTNQRVVSFVYSCQTTLRPDLYPGVKEVTTKFFTVRRRGQVVERDCQRIWQVFNFNRLLRNWIFELNTHDL